MEDEHSDIKLDLKDTGILPSDNAKEQEKEEDQNQDIAMANETEKNRQSK